LDSITRLSSGCLTPPHLVRKAPGGTAKPSLESQSWKRHKKPSTQQFLLATSNSIPKAFATTAFVFQSTALLIALSS
jgi:hypothetical protein